MHQQTSPLRCYSLLLPFTMIRSTNLFPLLPSIPSTPYLFDLLISTSFSYLQHTWNAMIQQSIFPFLSLQQNIRFILCFFLIAGNGHHTFYYHFLHLLLLPFLVCSFCLCCVFLIICSLCLLSFTLLSIHSSTNSLFLWIQQILNPLFYSPCTPTFQIHFSYDAHLEYKKWKNGDIL